MITAKTLAAIRNKIEEILEDTKDKITYPWRELNRRLSNLQYGTHCLPSNLKRGEWHEFDTRVFHSVFDSFVQFIETEQAIFQWQWKDIEEFAEFVGKERASDIVPKWYHRPIFAFLGAPKWDGSKLALEMYRLGINDPQYMTPMKRKELTLYVWYRYLRPARPDSYELSGLDKFREDHPDYEHRFFRNKQTRTKLDAEYEKMLNIMSSIDRDYADIDNKMLLDLISIRSSLWT